MTELIQIDVALQKLKEIQEGFDKAKSDFFKAREALDQALIKAEAVLKQGTFVEIKGDK